jgi:hypothetical protein
MRKNPTKLGLGGIPLEPPNPAVPVPIVVESDEPSKAAQRSQRWRNAQFQLDRNAFLAKERERKAAERAEAARQKAIDEVLNSNPSPVDAAAAALKREKRPAIRRNPGGGPSYNPDEAKYRQEFFATPKFRVGKLARAFRNFVFRYTRVIEPRRTKVENNGACFCLLCDPEFRIWTVGPRYELIERLAAAYGHFRTTHAKELDRIFDGITEKPEKPECADDHKERVADFVEINPEYEPAVLVCPDCETILAVPPDRSDKFQVGENLPQDVETEDFVYV